VKGSLEAWEGGAGPGVAAEMERVLVAFGFIFVFESVVAVLTCVLLFHLVSPEVALVGWLLKSVCGGRVLTVDHLDYRTFWVSWDNNHRCIGR